MPAPAAEDQLGRGRGPLDQVVVALHGVVGLADDVIGVTDVEGRVGRRGGLLLRRLQRRDLAARRHDQVREGREEVRGVRVGREQYARRRDRAARRVHRPYGRRRGTAASAGTAEASGRRGGREPRGGRVGLQIEGSGRFCSRAVGREQPLQHERDELVRPQARRVPLDDGALGARDAQAAERELAALALEQVRRGAGQTVALTRLAFALAPSDDGDVGGQVRVRAGEVVDDAADLGEQRGRVEGVDAAGRAPVARDGEVLDQGLQVREVAQLEGGDVRLGGVDGGLAVASILLRAAGE